MNPKSSSSATGGGKNTMMLILIFLVVVVIILIGVMAYPSVKDKLTMEKSKDVVDDSSYYAIFLSNGQVYFGHLADPSKDYSTLTDIYYLQLNQQQQQQQTQVQPAEGEQPELQDQSQEKEPELSLVKLGKELHGPEDKMVINKDHILFYEKLKEDSNVVKAIEEDKEKQE